MTQGDLDAAKVVMHKILNDSGYGSWVSDAKVEEVAYAIIEAVDEHRKKRTK
jgi:hypothetical protein